MVTKKNLTLSICLNSIKENNSHAVAIIFHCTVTADFEKYWILDDLLSHNLRRNGGDEAAVPVISFFVRETNPKKYARMHILCSLYASYLKNVYQRKKNYALIVLDRFSHSIKLRTWTSDYFIKWTKKKFGIYIIA